MTGESKPLYLHDIITMAAARRPETVAVVDADGAWTYAELAGHTEQYAAAMAAAGVKAGDRVLIGAESRRWVVAAIHGCSRLGAIAVPLGSDLRPAQWEQIGQDARPALVLTAPPATAPVAVPPPHPTDADAPVLFMYTSGSTSTPKAVVCPHRSVLFAVEAIAARLRYRPDDVVLCRLPLSFDYGLYQVFLTAHSGGTLVLCGSRADGRLLSTAVEHGATVVPLVPSLATMLAQLAKRGDVPPVRLFTNTGQELTADHISALRQAFPGAAVQLMYGTTECKRVTIGEPDDDLVRPGSVGRPLDGTTVRILGEDGAPVPPGEEGQITVHGPHVMAGYWPDEPFPRDPITGDRVLHTGDYGHVDQDGHLYFHGRRDQLFKHRGVRTSVSEIEAAARAVPEIEDAAVLPPRGEGEAVLCAVTTLEPAEALRRLRDRLEPLKVPARCLVLDRMPLSANGKTDRTALAALIDHAEMTRA
ncbi:class I adenylate-forming enzyme family protein [Kutzneria sp. NPDC052558]|uniref:class I adenylate-forming enzyme family protein n=1 Tax=Kutzneria sp. NPDC052558 TaxID=3364121 RepID=UPI0037CB4D5A